LKLLSFYVDWKDKKAFYLKYFYELFDK
jgi:hypothetical protein